MQISWPEWLPKLGPWLIPYIVLAIFIIGIFASIWLIYHVEYSERFSIKKVVIAILIISLSFGYTIFFVAVHLALLF
ncbi:MAG: hypothetical protein ABGF52_09000 [Candidatus Asgardarchaeum sp.]|nr:hypothetical protein [Candidatus Odinarchaeota archaeon]